MSDKAVLMPLSNGAVFIFHCPGCGYGHHLNPQRWTWNGDLVRPTASPSLLVNATHLGDVPRCHFFIRDGSFHYCSDSTHHLAGQVVPMQPIEDG